jgi:hypothetical protein
MNLQEKFWNIIKKPQTDRPAECGKIADEHAIDFGEWICEKAGVPYIKGTMDKTLEIFKNEKKL